MQKTTDHTNGVMNITSLARRINPEIGSYVEHYINENFEFTVRLTNNGGIKMSMMIAQDYENQPSSITPEMIQRVADSYWRY